MAKDDVELVALSGEARETRIAIAALFCGDGRDASDIPGFAALADRHLAALRELADGRAEGVPGLLAKARAIDPRDAAMRSESVVALALSIAADVVSVLGTG